MNHTVEGKITDENIKSMFNVYMDYKVNEPDENGVFEFSETQLDETIKISVPYDEGYYLLNYVDGVTYDVKTEYINGSYVFDTKNLGTFMFSTKSTGKTEPVKTESVELAQQTITDEATGVTVSGMLPVDAKMDVLLCFYGEQRIHPFSSYYLNNFEDNYPKHQDITTYVCSSEFERDVDADAGRIFTVIGEDGWTQYVGTGEDGKFELAITFIKDYEVLEFESDLTVTLPFDYREALVKGSRIGTASAMQYDYTKKEFVTLEVLPQDATEQGTYQFKAKAPGQFFIGDDIALNLLVKHYSADASERVAMMQ